MQGSHQVLHSMSMSIDISVHTKVDSWQPFSWPKSIQQCQSPFSRTISFFPVTSVGTKHGSKHAETYRRNCRESILERNCHHLGQHERKARCGSVLKTLGKTRLSICKEQIMFSSCIKGIRKIIRFVLPLSSRLALSAYFHGDMPFCHLCWKSGSLLL
jgi:hypothetical protein